MLCVPRAGLVTRRVNVLAEPLEAVPQEEIGGSAAAVAPPQARPVVVADHERDSRRIVQKPRDAVIEIRPAAVEQAFGAMGDRFVQPVLLFGKPWSSASVGRATAEADGMRVLMDQQRAEMRTRKRLRIDVHHVAAVAERQPQKRLKIAPADESADRSPPPLQSAEPGTEQNGKPSVVIDVAICSQAAPGNAE